MLVAARRRLYLGGGLRSTSGALTLSGNEITDAVRSAGTEGDGRTVPDRTTGIWEATTNLITNGGAETNPTGHTADGATVGQDAAESKFGAASIEVQTDDAAANEGAYHAFTGAAATAYSASVWAWGSGTVRIALWDDVAGKQASSPVTLTATPQRLTVTATTGAGAASFRVYVETNVQQAITYNYDGLQVEAQPIATPYVETDGDTAARSAARVRIPVASLFTATQGAVYIRARMGFASTTFPHAAPGLFEWPDDGNNLLYAHLDSGGNVTFQRKATSADTANAAWSAWSLGDSVLWGIEWTATTIAASQDGVLLATPTSSTNIPTLAATLADIGSLQVATSGVELDSDVFWVATFAGTLTAADRLALDAIGDKDPDLRALRSMLSSGARPTAVWDGLTGRFERVA